MPSGQYRFTGHTLAAPLAHEYPAAHGATVPLMHRLPAAQVSHCHPARGLAALVWRLKPLSQTQPEAVRWELVGQRHCEEVTEPWRE